MPIPVAVPSNALVCSRLITGIAGSNPAGGMDVRLLCLLCKWRHLQRADHSFRGVIRRMYLETSKLGGLGPLLAVATRKKYWNRCIKSFLKVLNISVSNRNSLVPSS
jgi:hypothetical protein